MSELERRTSDGRLPKFPETRYMGSKQSLLGFIRDTVESLDFAVVLDAFSGSGCVSHMFKAQGKRVFSNDHLHFSYQTAVATIQNNRELIGEDLLSRLLAPNAKRDDFIERTFAGLYFADEDNRFLDNVWANIRCLTDTYARALAVTALCRACIKKRPRGIFTYTGVDRYNDGRRDLRLSFEEQYRRAVLELNDAVFDNGHENMAFNEDVFDLVTPVTPQLVYIDPPYVTPHSDNDYLRRYHFVEGLSSYWTDRRAEILHRTKTKKLRRYPTPFSSRNTVTEAFDRLFSLYPSSVIVVSYSSNCLPPKEEMIALLRNHKSRIMVESYRHRYSFGTYNHLINNPTNEVDEYLYVAL